MRRRRSGFIMLVAITMLALCALAAAVVLQLARDDVRRTVGERTEAQQRQLLLAGLRDATARLNAGETLVAGAIAVPAEAGETLAIDGVESPSADRAVVTFASGTLRQRATFERAAGVWRLARAELLR